MKYLRVISLYQQYVSKYYRDKKNEINKNYSEQYKEIMHDAFSWSDFFEKELNTIGYDAEVVVINAEPMQRAWARENGMKNYDNISLEEILIEQIKKIKPEILFYDHIDEELLKIIKRECKTIQYTIGWTGSAIAKTKQWSELDIVLSCAPESVEILKSNNINSEHLNHAFDNEINLRLKESKVETDVIFIGQLIRGNQFHQKREEMLLDISNNVNLSIHSPSYEIGIKDELSYQIRNIIYSTVSLNKDIKEMILKIPQLKNKGFINNKPYAPINKKIKKYLKPALFGLEMYQSIKNSKIALNIHADSSPIYASNMRLFESTGVGTCLITENKKNISDLFIPDKEVVVYDSPEECVEKIKWLINNEEEMKKISYAGQEKTLKNHNFKNRAMEFDKIIKNDMKRREK